MAWSDRTVSFLISAEIEDPEPVARKMYLNAFRDFELGQLLRIIPSTEQDNINMLEFETILKCVCFCGRCEINET